MTVPREYRYRQADPAGLDRSLARRVRRARARRERVDHFVVDLHRGAQLPDFFLKHGLLLAEVFQLQPQLPDWSAISPPPHAPAATTAQGRRPIGLLFSGLFVHKQA
jgi:hypothetical protein